MKRYLYLFMVLVLSLLVTACDKPDNGDEGDDEIEKITHQELMEKYNSTLIKYMVSQNVNIFMEVNIDSVKSKVEFIYNLNGFNVSGLKYISNVNEENYEVYVDSKVEYVNFNGSKSKNDLDSASEGKIITDFSFVKITDEFFSLFDDSLMNSLEVTGQKDNDVTLKWNKSLYVITDNTNLGIFNEVSENMEDIEVKISYEDDEVKRIESSWKNKNGKTNTLKLELRGMDENTITYPSDLSSYKSRGE